MGDEVRYFLGPVGRQGHDRDHADAHEREKGDHELDRVGQLEHDAIERPESEIDQAPG